MRSFYNRKLRVFSPPLLFLIILPCSPKAMIAPCKHFTRHKCQCWSAILIQEFISFVFAEVQRTVWPESRQGPPTRNIPCAHLGGAVLLMKRKFLFQNQGWMMFNLAEEPCSCYDFHGREWITSGISCWIWDQDCSHEIQCFYPARHGFHLSWGERRNLIGVV